MKVVALISGGKDSTFNAMHCVANGHEIIALANLMPPSGVEELDSFMFQTVGNSLLAAYKECYGVPLYQRVIQGNARITTNDYSLDVDDEVEDMFRLLQSVKQKHPHVEAVSVGAILSNYQRIRVENVCGRLGLVCLSYLWRQEQDYLLASMVNNEIKAIVVKVAAMGLTKNDLGLTLDKLKIKMDAIASKLGLNICGEGGEYETITLDCPIFKNRIVIDEYSVVTARECDIAPICYLRIDKFHIEPKEGIEPFGLKWDPQNVDKFISTDLLQIPCSLSNNNFDVSQINGLKFSNDFSIIKQETECTFIFIVLKDMNQYSEFNKQYSEYFSGMNVPTRACIEFKDIFGDTECFFAMKTFSTKFTKRFMHVQSISYWAPANIGPYSQYLEWDEPNDNSEISKGIISGILGLISHLMIPGNGMEEQLSLILNHLKAILYANKKLLYDVSHLNIFVLNYCHNDLICHCIQNLFKSNLPKVLFYRVTRLPKDCLIEIQALINFEGNIL